MGLTDADFVDEDFGRAMQRVDRNGRDRILL